MYEAFFKLSKKPFELVPNPEFMYLSRSHKKVLTYLDYGIREGAGFILLTGDVGSGKTTLIRDILNKRYEHVVLAKIFNTRVSSEQLLSMINDDFGLAATGKDKVSLIRDLNDFLLEQYAQGKHPILIIDEAQNLGADLLEEIRMLSNLESSSCKLLQIVLVGQPELRQTLSAPGLLQLRQRISINCHLKALSRAEIPEYVTHRMAVAGNGDALDFPPETLNLVFQYSRGIPRLINIICDFLMLSAFAEEVRSVSVEMARDVIGDLDFENHFWGGDTALAGPAAQPVPLGQASELLEEVARRLDAFDQDVSQKLPELIKGVTDALGAVRGEVAEQSELRDRQIGELSRKLETVSLAVESLMLSTAQNRPAAAGFARRLMDGMIGAGAKR